MIEAHSPPKQGMGFDHATYLARLGDFDHREAIKRRNLLFPVWQVAQDQLHSNKWMNGNVVTSKLLIQFGVSFTKVIDPHRRIRKNHFAFVPRRGMSAIRQMHRLIQPVSARLPVRSTP